MKNLFEQHKAFIVPHSRILLDSYQHWTGRELLARREDDEATARALFEAPFAVLSGGPQEDQILNYGNLTTLGLWEMDWDTLVRTPSRYTAEPMHRDERAEFLRQVRENGYIDNYQGIRISSTGKRFRIEQATVWNLINQRGEFVGQAATFKSVTRL
jgi:hypothetical protein